MEPLLEQVAAYVQERAAGELIIDRTQLPESCQLAVRTDGALAFFRSTPAARLKDHWQQAQTEIAELPAERLPLRRLYLTLLVTDSDQPRPIWQDIMRDLHVCRKLVVAAADRPVDDWADELPFLPIPEDALRPRAMVTPAEALYQAGFRSDLAHDLLSRSADKLAPQFGAGTVLRGVAEAPPQAMDLIPRSAYRRLHKIEIENFRPFAKLLSLELDADLTLIYGPNGSGKSSIAQALEWSIIGEVPALEQKHDDVSTGEQIPPYINVMNLDTPARVQLHLQDEVGGVSSLERQIERNNDKRTLWGGRDVSLSDGLLRLLAADVPDGASLQTLQAMARKSHFLDQETIRNFLSTTAKDRYTALANMVGTVDFVLARKKLKELRPVLTKERDEVARAEQEVRLRLERESQTLTDLQRQLADVTGDGSSALDLAEAARELARTGADLGLPVRLQAPPDPAGLQQFARSFLEGLEADRPAAQDRHARLSAVALDEASAHQARTDAAALHSRHAETERELAEVQAELAGIAESIAALRTRREAAETDWADAQQHARGASGRLTATQALSEAGHAWLRTRQAEADAAAELEAAEAEARAARAEADAAADRVRTVTAQQERLRGRLTNLAELRSRLPAVETAAATVQQSMGALAELARKQDIQQTERQALLRNLNDTENRVAELSATVKQLEQRCAERQRLLGALSRHLDGACCPLCSHDWAEADLLNQQVQAALRETPAELLSAQQDLAAEAERLNQLKLDRDQALNRTSALDAEARDWERRAAAARGTIQDWQCLAATVANGDDMLTTPSAALVERWEAACHAADRAADLAALTTEAATAEQRAGSAEVRRAAASRAVTEAAQATVRVEPRYKAAEQAAPAGATRPVPHPDQIADLEAELATATRTAQAALESLRTAREQLQAAEAARSCLTRTEAALSSRLTSTDRDLRTAEGRHSAYLAALAGLGLPDEPGAPSAALSALRERLTAMDRLQERASWLAEAARVRLLSDAVATAITRVAQVEAELANARRQTQRWDAAIASADKAAAALDNAREDEQNKRLTYYEPTINEIYRRINPHPYFSVIRLQPAVKDSRLTMHASTPEGKQHLPVQRYFSMAQSNVVALSIFLGTALLQTWSGLRLICIDDPIQQMDDLNTVAFLDVLHGVIQRRRQVVLTTANKEFYQLMLRRYAYLNQQTTRFRAFRLHSIDLEKGPAIAEDSPYFQPDGSVRLGPPETTKRP